MCEKLLFQVKHAILGNRQCFYPLTISEYRSRYLRDCEGLTSSPTDFAFSVFDLDFQGLRHALCVRQYPVRPLEALVLALVQPQI
jgi:hypothetical protein